MFRTAEKLSTIHKYFKNDLRRYISNTTSVYNRESMATLQRFKRFPEKVTRDTEWKSFSTVSREIVPQSMVSQNESCEFKAVFPDIVKDLTNFEGHTDMPEVTTRFAKVLQYNVPHGKLNRGVSVASTYKIMEEPQNQTPENIRLVHILGWCVELVQSGFLISDDITDSSEIRRGNLCWYKVDGVGFQAINDAIAVESSLYILLKKYFSNHHCYLPALELFNDIVFKTSLGQSYDCMCLKNGKPNLDAFTMSRYNTIVKYKAFYATFQLPVKLAMYFAGKYEPDLHKQADSILFEIGHFFQVQNDFLDCFGNLGVTERVGTDISKGKCSWLVVVALQKATPEQKTILHENYGKPDPECEVRVRNLYEELGLRETYCTYEDEILNTIRTHIHEIPNSLPHKIFFSILEKINKRER